VAAWTKVKNYYPLRRIYRKLRWLLKPKSKAETLAKLWQKRPDNYSRPWQSYHYLCIDLEFSSLQSDQGDLLSIGWVEIVNGKLLLSTSEHQLIKNRESVGQSASIHHIRDCDAAQGIDVKEAFDKFLSACEGKILIFHHANVDLSYLNKISKKFFGSALLLPFCDTLKLERKKLQKRQELIPEGSLRLQQCRERYQLPAYPQHNALVDAIATGELFMAHARAKGKKVVLRDLLRRG